MYKGFDTLLTNFVVLGIGSTKLDNEQLFLQCLETKGRDLDPGISLLRKDDYRQYGQLVLQSYLSMFEEQILMVDRYIVLSRVGKQQLNGFFIILKCYYLLQKNYCSSKLQQMGSQCTSCEKAYLTTDSKQLESIFLGDQKAGFYLNLSSEHKKTYWQKIKSNQFYLQALNKLIPFQQSKNKIILYYPQRYFYQGPVEDDLPHGEGRLNIIQTAIIQGTFNKGQLNGSCKISYKGDKQIRGLWSQGRPTQIELRKQKGKYEINFQDQKLNKGLVKFPNKNEYSGQFHYDSRQKMVVIAGRGALKYANGDIIQGQFINGYLQGQGTYKSAKEMYIYTGLFQRGLFNGQGICDFGDKGVLRINWKDNKPQGKGEFSLNGLSYNVFYERGVRKQLQRSKIYQ